MKDGVDYDATAIDSILFTADRFPLHDSVFWSIPGSVVKGWIDNPGSNNGLVFKSFDLTHSADTSDIELVAKNIADQHLPGATRLELFMTHLAPICGDVDGDGSVDFADVVRLISHIFGSDPNSQIFGNADVNCDGHTDITDVVYLINYTFKEGPPPCANCD